MRTDAEQQRAGGADRDPDRAAEQLSDVAALVLAERDHQAAAEHGEPGAKRPDVHELAARHHQRAEHDERDRHDVLRVARSAGRDRRRASRRRSRRSSRSRGRHRGRGRARSSRAPRAPGCWSCARRASLRPRLLDAARELRTQLRLPLRAAWSRVRPAPAPLLLGGHLGDEHPVVASARRRRGRPLAPSRRPRPGARGVARASRPSPSLDELGEREEVEAVRGEDLL